MKRFLRQHPSGDIYHFTEHLAARPDMVELPEDEVPEHLGGTKKAKRGAKLEARPQPEPEQPEGDKGGEQ